MREGWNFHNDIALNLERIARNEYGFKDRPIDKIFDADMIESCTFVEVMIAILRQKTNMSSNNCDVEKFVEQSARFFNKSGLSIAPEEAEKLYELFEDIYDKLS